MANQRKNFVFDDIVLERLDKISEYYGMNKTATISMLITEKFNAIKKDIEEQNSNA